MVTKYDLFNKVVKMQNLAFKNAHSLPESVTLVTDQRRRRLAAVPVNKYTTDLWVHPQQGYERHE